MKLDLNKFYNTNYRDFVHKEAVEEALKLVPEVELKDVEIDNILSIAFSVDEYGENPMYIEYLGKDGKTHLVRIRPAVSNEIQELLKRYVTLEQHENDKNAIYNHFETLNVPIELRSENGLDEEGNRKVILNNNNSAITFQVDPETNEAIQWLCIHNMGGLGTSPQYFARFVDFAKVDEVPSNADFAEKVQELEEKMNTAYNRVLEASKEYTDSTITSLGDELNVKIEQTKNDLTVLIEEKTQDTLQQAKDYADTKDVEYFETSKRYTDNAKREAINECKAYTDAETDETLIASKSYTDIKHTEVTQDLSELEDDVNTNFATKREMLANVESLSVIDGQNYIELNEKINNKADKQTVDDLSQLVQKIANKVDGIEIGERTKVNFVLSNSNNDEPINPTITSNDSYYVKVGSQYIISVYLTFEINVTPTSTQKTVAFSWLHDLPGENPPLTLTAEMIGNREMYSTTKRVKTNKNRVSFSIPAFPATETYLENKITIYGTAITKDLSKEGEHND